MDRKKVVIILLLIPIFLIGLFLRVFNLNNSPPSLNWDEAAWGYNAYSISQTSKDEYGVTMPIFTRSFDEYKPTLPTYLMIPTIKIFGLNEVGVRLPSAIIGSLLIILTYLLTKKLFNSVPIALLAAFLIAIEPWAVHLSRVYHDANEALFFLVFGLYLYELSKKRNYFLVFSALTFMVSMYTYNANKVIVPLLLICITLIDRKKLKLYSKNSLRFVVAVLSFGLLLFLLLTLWGEALARAGSTNILRVWDGNPLNFITEVIGRYLAYFSPANLFVREPLEPSTVIPNLSLFLPFEFLGWVVGLIFILRSKIVPLYFKVLILIAPIPAAVTWNWFQPGRGLTLFFVFTICIACGFIFIITLIKPKIVRYFATAGIILWAIINVIFVFDAENVSLPARDAGNWQPGYREVVPLVMNEEKDFDQVIIDTPHAQPYIFYLFYGKYPPAKYLGELDLKKIGTPRKVYDFGKFTFRKIDPNLDIDMDNTLFVISKESGKFYSFPGDRVKYVRDIYDKYGNPIAQLVATY